MLIFVSWKIHLICRLGGGKKKYNRVVYWISIINSFVVYTLTAAKKKPFTIMNRNREWVNRQHQIDLIYFLFCGCLSSYYCKNTHFQIKWNERKGVRKKNVVLRVGQSKQNSDSSYQKQSYRKWTEKVVKVM